MNATRWTSLSEFIKQLGRSGIVRVDETDKGLFVAWIDNSPKALAKAVANQKKERQTTSDEQRERTLIAEQIERAKAAGEDDDAEEGSEDAAPEPVGLQRDDNAGPLRLSFGVKKSNSPPAPEESTSGPSSSGPSPSAITPSSSSTAVPAPQPALKFNAFKKASTSSAVPTKTNPLKMNVFKSSSSKASSTAASDSSTLVGEKRARDEMPAAQRLMMEEQERKRRRVGAM